MKVSSHHEGLPWSFKMVMFALNLQYICSSSDF